MLSDPELVVSLLGLTSPFKFATDYWGRKPLMVKRAMTPEWLASCDPLQDALRFLLDERLLLMLEARVRNAKRGSRSLTVGTDINEIIESGDHIQLRNLQKVLAPTHPVVQLARQLEIFLGHPLDSISTIISPKDSQMIPGHFDMTEIFTIQVCGSKSWSLSHSGCEPAQHFNVEPGDMLYVPARMRHTVLSTGEIAISYALVYRPIRLDSVLAELARDIFTHSPRHAETLPIMKYADSHNALISRYDLYIEEWQQLLNSIDSDILLWKGQQLSRLLASPRPFQFIVNWDSVKEDTAFERSPEPASVDYVAGKIHLTAGGGITVIVPGTAILELSQILFATGPFTAEKIVAVLTPSEALLLMRTLYQIGLIRLAVGYSDQSASREIPLSYLGSSPRFIAFLSATKSVVDTLYGELLESDPAAALQGLCSRDGFRLDAVLKHLRMINKARLANDVMSRAPYTPEDIRLIIPEGYER